MSLLNKIIFKNSNVKVRHLEFIFTHTPHKKKEKKMFNGKTCNSDVKQEKLTNNNEVQENHQTHVH